MTPRTNHLPCAHMMSTCLQTFKAQVYMTFVTETQDIHKKMSRVQSYRCSSSKAAARKITASGWRGSHITKKQYRIRRVTVNIEHLSHTTNQRHRRQNMQTHFVDVHSSALEVHHDSHPRAVTHSHKMGTTCLPETFCNGASCRE